MELPRETEGGKKGDKQAISLDTSKQIEWTIDQGNILSAFLCLLPLSPPSQIRQKKKCGLRFFFGEFCFASSHGPRKSRGGWTGDLCSSHDRFIYPIAFSFFLCCLLLDVEGIVSGLTVQNICTQTRTHITQHTTHGFLLRLDQRNSARSLSLSVWG